MFSPIGKVSAVGVRFDRDMLYIRLSDGREIGAPLDHYKRKHFGKLHGCQIYFSSTNPLRYWQYGFSFEKLAISSNCSAVI